MKITLIFFLFLLLSCQLPTIEREFYQETGKIKEERIYSSEKESDYRHISYYSNGQIKESGEIVDFLKEGFWQYYYLDGEMHSLIPYKKGKIKYCDPNRQLPQIYLFDSLVVDFPVRCRVSNLFPEETFTVSSNAHILPFDKDDLYDFYLIISEGDSVSFYYDQKLEEIQIGEKCMNNLEANLEYLSKKEMQNISIYKTRSVTIATFPICK